MSKQRKWNFIVEGAKKMEGGNYSGPRVGGLFTIWYVTGGDGVKFRRCPYTDSGWKVQKNRTSCDGKPIEYVVKDPEDIAALNAFVGVDAYSWYGVRA